jgi:glutaredoxin 3
VPTPEIKVYTTPYCGFCRMALRLLDQKGAAYEQIDVTGDGEKRAWLREATGQRTVPQIFINGESIGGYMELSALDRSGELDRKLAA